MQTMIYTNLLNIPIDVRESYQTTKKRLFDNQPFMEITSMKKKKILLNKADVVMVTTEESTSSEMRIRPRKGNKKQ